MSLLKTINITFYRKNIKFNMEFSFFYSHKNKLRQTALEANPNDVPRMFYSSQLVHYNSREHKFDVNILVMSSSNHPTLPALSFLIDMRKYSINTSYFLFIDQAYYCTECRMQWRNETLRNCYLIFKAFFHESVGNYWIDTSEKLHTFSFNKIWCWCYFCNKKYAAETKVILIIFNLNNFLSSCSELEQKFCLRHKEKNRQV